MSEKQWFKMRRCRSSSGCTNTSPSMLPLSVCYYQLVGHWAASMRNTYLRKKQWGPVLHKPGQEGTWEGNWQVDGQKSNGNPQKAFTAAVHGRLAFSVSSFRVTIVRCLSPARHSKHCCSGSLLDRSTLRQGSVHPRPGLWTWSSSIFAQQLRQGLPRPSFVASCSLRFGA